MLWIGIGIGVVLAVAVILIIAAVSDNPVEYGWQKIDPRKIGVRRDIDEERLETCPASLKPKKPSIDGSSRDIQDVRTDPFWGPILFPEGPSDQVNDMELAAHLEDYMRLCSGAAQVVELYAAGISGGYKFYSVEGVLQCIQEHIENENKSAVDDFISDHQIDAMKKFVVDIERALGCSHNHNDWRKSVEACELRLRAGGFINADGVSDRIVNAEVQSAMDNQETDIKIRRIAGNEIVPASSMASGFIEAKGQIIQKLTSKERDELMEMIRCIEVPMALMHDLNKFFIDLIHDSDKPDDSRSRDLWIRVQKHTR